MDETSIQDSIDALLRVLTVYENRLYPKDRAAFDSALAALYQMKSHGFK